MKMFKNIHNYRCAARHRISLPHRQCDRRARAKFILISLKKETFNGEKWSILRLLALLKSSFVAPFIEIAEKFSPKTVYQAVSK